MNNSKRADYTDQGKRYFQRGATIPHQKPEGPVVLDIPVWMERTIAWFDRFVRLLP